jgi:hypothetical protein
MSRPQIIESCRSCGSRQLEWQPDNGWITRPIRYLRCASCGDCIRTQLPAWGWILYAIALVAAVWAFVSIL